MRLVSLKRLGDANAMNGSKCRCGFATTSQRTKCPRCGREMEPSEWEEIGKVLSFLELRVAPQGFENPYNMALVEIDDDGPKVICWTTNALKENDEVVVSEFNGKYICSPRSEQSSGNSKSD